MCLLVACDARWLTHDRCERLCVDVADAVETCSGTHEELTWAALGATSHADYVRTCRRDWERTRAALGTRDVELALGICATAREDLAELDCAAIAELYAPDPP